MRHLCLVGRVKGSGSVQYFFCKQKQHEDSRAQLVDLWKELEKNIGELESMVVDSKIQFSVNFMFRRMKKEGKQEELQLRWRSLPPPPTFGSETGERIFDEKLKVHPESSEASIYLMQKLRIRNSKCLTFFDSGANTHLIDSELAKKEKITETLR